MKAKRVVALVICTAVITVVAVAFSKYLSNGYWGWNNDTNTYINISRWMAKKQ